MDLVQDAIDEMLETRRAELVAIAPELAPLVEIGGDLLQGGKRFRALFLYWGWHAISARVQDFDPLTDAVSEHLPAVVRACAALEVFHAAALVHDDVLDNSDTRRGRPSAHRRFEALHRETGWHGSSAEYGRAGALLLGDMLLGWSDEVLDEALAMLGRPAAARAARAEFVRMRTEVTAGQFLDILEENAWRVAPESELLARAHRVIVYKSAKYSVEAPLALGAAMAGAAADQLDALRAFGLPLGVAFQLRDDLLGVFGDPEVTGKPAGDDLREGKRTVLIALARSALPPTARRLLDELLGDRSLDEEQIRMLQSTIRDSGAVARVEGVIDRQVAQARAALEEAPIAASSRQELVRLAQTVAKRVS